MILNDFMLAESMFMEGNGEEAFWIFSQIAVDELRNNAERADAYNMMGVIVNGIAPHLDLEDESGLKYYKKALLLDPDNIGALLNIIGSFGMSPNMHRDVDVFLDTYNRLMNKKEELEYEDKKMIERKYELGKQLLIM